MIAWHKMKALIKKKKKKYFHKTITMYIKYYSKFLVTQKLICLTETNLYKSRIIFFI